MIFLDTETRSGVDIRRSNVYRYAEDPGFSVLMLTWAEDDGRVHVDTDPDTIRDRFRGWVDSDVTLAAHNAAFDRIVLSTFAGLGTYHDPARWVDTAMWAAESGLPRALGKLAAKLGVEQKDTAGTTLINWFSKPQRDGTFRDPADHPDRWQQFCDYGATDVEVLRQCFALLPEPCRFEQDLWVVSERINDRGIRVDLELARAAVQAGKDNTLAAKQRVSSLLGISNPGSVQQLTAGLAEAGLVVPNLRASTVEWLLAMELTDVQREALELRQELALSSYKKFQAALDGACADNRIRGAFRFYGASTGRFSGSGAQPQNLPRAALHASPVDVVDVALTENVSIKDAQTAEDIRVTGEAIAALHTTGSADTSTLKALVRSMFLGPMTVCDFASIEARVLAWLAGEQWALDAFRAGEDLYQATAERMGPQFTRQEGKAAVLGLGYGGAVGALRNIGMEGPDELLTPLVQTWRAANRRIVNFWYRLWDVWRYGGVHGRIRVSKTDGARTVHLPSGGSIVYRGVRFEKYTVVDDEGVKHHKEGWRYDRPVGGRVAMWHGLFAENVTQRIARDLLAHALIGLEAAGLDVVAHVHDEVLVDGVVDVATVAGIMCDAPAWANGLPLDAEGFVADRYRKG